MHFVQEFSPHFSVLGLYQPAQECCNLQKPTLKTNQDFVQTSPLLDGFYLFWWLDPSSSQTRRILFYYHTKSTENTSLSAGPSLHQIWVSTENLWNSHSSRNNISATIRNICIIPGTSGRVCTIWIDHRPTPSQWDPGTPSGTSFRYNTFRKLLVTQQRPSTGHHRHFRDDGLWWVHMNCDSNSQWPLHNPTKMLSAPSRRGQKTGWGSL